MSSTASGQILWGADGHEDQGGPYTSISLQQQASDLHTVFGKGTVLYRDFGDGLSPSAEDSDVSTMQAQGIQPIVVVDTYPPWGSFSSQQDAYNWGFQRAQAMAQGSTAQYFEIGNEWSGDPTDFPSSGNGSQPSDWTSGPNFQDAVAVTAGAIAAIRQYDASAKIIGGAENGWTDEGFAVAVAQALQSQYPGDIWDYTSLHWYSNMGDDPSNFNGGMNAYALLKSIGKPLAITEFGDSSGNPNDLTAMMQSFENNAAPSATSPGIALATMYELYPNGGWTNDLYNVNGSASTLAPDGQAVKSEIASFGGNSSGSGSSGGSGGSSPGGGSTATPSSNDTTITPGNGTITDGSGDVWTITNAGTIDMNGQPAGYSTNVVEGAFVNGTVWQENSQGSWWSWTNGGWQAGSDPLPASGGRPVVRLGVLLAAPRGLELAVPRVLGLALAPERRLPMTRS